MLDCLRSRDLLSLLCSPFSLIPALTCRDDARRGIRQFKDTPAQQQPHGQQGPPQQPVFEQWPRQPRVPRTCYVLVTNKHVAGAVAGVLAGMLRTHQQADVHLINLLAITKALKVVALANIFLSPHNICTFCFKALPPWEHRTRLARMVREPHLKVRVPLSLSAMHVGLPAELRSARSPFSLCKPL